VSDKLHKNKKALIYQNNFIFLAEIFKG